MLTCKEFLQELSDFLDDSVSAEERAELEKHLSECPNCWVIADTTRKTVEVFRGEKPAPLPDPVKQRLMEALARRRAALQQPPGPTAT